MKTRNLLLTLVFILGTIFSCETPVEFELHNNEDVFESVYLTLEPQIIQAENSGIKVASVPQFDSLEVTMYYDKNGIWTKVAKSNFADTTDIDLSDFINPFKAKVERPLRVGHILKAMCRFDIRGFSDAGENTYYGIIEKDLRSASNEESIIVPMVETKSYFGLNIKELTVNDYKYVFDYSYTLHEIDYENCKTQLAPITGQVPEYLYINSGTQTSQLVVQGQSATLNSVAVNFNDYIDMAEHFGGCAVNGMDFTVTIFDGETQVSQTSINKNWLEFGFNHYVQVKNVTVGSFDFDLVDNEDVVEEWDLSGENGGNQTEDVTQGL